MLHPPPPQFRLEKAISPRDGSPMWVVVDRDYDIHPDAELWLSALRGQQDASPNTARTYGGRIALYLSYCHDRGIDWSAPTMGQLAAMLRWLIDEPLPAKGPTAPAEPRHRSKNTANAILGTVCQFLRFSALEGPVSPELAARLHEPKQLRYMPAGYDHGEDGQYATVRVKAIKFKVAVPGYEYLTESEIHQLIDATTRARDRFLVSLLAATGMRIGEALGLRREDMHLLPDSSAFGCRVKGAHIHVRRRQNANGASAKSRHPRWIPVGEDIAALYADCQWERDAVPQAAGCDMVFVNLFAAPLGEPMKYASTYELFKRLAKRAEVSAHPHMLRHSALTRWVRQGKPRHVIQNLAGHQSAQSMEQYFHASDQEKRDAVNLVTQIQETGR